MQKGRKSPLKDNPLRNPGQSLDERINDLIMLDGSTYYSIAFFSIVLACLEWFRWYMEFPYTPIILTIVAVIVTIYSGRKIIKIKKLLNRLRLGRDGEVVVGHELDNLKAKGYRVFHDLVGYGFNIDHVVVCEHGVFTVETKTYSKPESGETEIVVQNERVIVDGYPSDKIAVQAKAEANWLQKIIYKATEKKKGAVLLLRRSFIDHQITVIAFLGT